MILSRNRLCHLCLVLTLLVSSLLAGIGPFRIVGADPVQAFSVSGSITGGGSITLRVTLPKDATSDVTVSLNSNRPSIIPVPATMTVSKGSRSSSISVVTRAVKIDYDVTITGKWLGVTGTKHVTVKAPRISSVTIDSTVTGNDDKNLAIRMNAKAPDGGINLGLKASRPSLVSFPSSNVHIGTGSSLAIVPIHFKGFSGGSADITFTATFNDQTVSATITALGLSTPTITSATRTPTSGPIGTQSVTVVPSGTVPGPSATPTRTNTATATRTPTKTATSITTATNTPVGPTATATPLTGTLVLGCPTYMFLGQQATCSLSLVVSDPGSVPNQTVNLSRDTGFVSLGTSAVTLVSPAFSTTFTITGSGSGNEIVRATLGGITSATSVQVANNTATLSCEYYDVELSDSISCQIMLAVAAPVNLNFAVSSSATGFSLPSSVAIPSGTLTKSFTIQAITTANGNSFDVFYAGNGFMTNTIHLSLFTE